MLRTALIATLTIAACHGETHKAETHKADPWSDPAPPAPPAKPAVRAPRVLDMDGKIEGATPALLATPLGSYAAAKVGDWRAFRHITTGKLGNFHATAIAVVTAVTATTVTIELSGRLDETGEQRSDGADVFPRVFTVEHEIHRQHGDWTASAVEVGEEPRVIDGRTFPCKKVTFASADPMFPTKQTKIEVWISPEVPAGGEVSQREVQQLGELVLPSTSDLIGFGDATRTMWGTRPAGL